MPQRKNNEIYVGSNKPVMNYVTACLQAMKFNGSIHIMARGRAISSAVDVVEVLRHRFIEADIDSIDLGTDDLDGKRISTIKIELTPKGALSS